MWGIHHYLPFDRSHILDFKRGTRRASRRVVPLLSPDRLEDRTLLSGGFDWIQQFGSRDSWYPEYPGDDYATDVAADVSGIYVAGWTSGTLPGQTSAGDYGDAFVRKYDANGNEIWTRQFGTAGYDYACSITADDSGIYVAGSMEGTLPGQTSAGHGDAFVRKYDTDGNELWTRQFGSADHDEAWSITADDSGIYVAGFTLGTLPGQTSAGHADAFVRKYDANGNEIWTRQFGTTSGDEAEAIAADDSGIYVAGFTLGTLPGQTSAGDQDAFVRKYDADGNEIWTRQFGSADQDHASDIAADDSGIYVAGATLGTLPGQNSAGDQDAFVRKYDADGNEIWTRQFGTTSSDEAGAIAADDSVIYVAGATLGTLPGQTSADAQDAFVRKYDADGNESWTYQFGTAEWDAAYGIDAVASGFYVGGQIGDSTHGYIDAFVAYQSFQVPGNSPPTADAGGPYTIHEGDSLTTRRLRLHRPRWRFPHLFLGRQRGWQLP